MNLTFQKVGRSSRVTLGFLFSLALLSACGQSPDSTSKPRPELQAACSGPGCGVGTGDAEGERYSGSGLGVWSYENTADSSQPLEVKLDGLENNDVTLVLTNPTAQPQTLQGDWTGRGTVNPVSPPPLAPITDPLPAGAFPTPPEAQQRTWTVPQNVTTPDISYRPYAATLRAQLTYEGFTYNFWVADEAWNERLRAVFPAIAAGSFGSPQYPGLLPQLLENFGVAPWGERPQTAANEVFIPPQTRDVNLVMAPTGGPDFFDSDQLQLPSAKPNSNGALTVFFNSAAFTCEGIPEGQCLDRDVLALGLYPVVLGVYNHELIHLFQAYQRTVRRGEAQAFETWLSEAMATAYSYTVGASRFPSNTFVNLLESGGWFNGGYTCSLTDNSGDPNSPSPVEDETCLQSYYKGGQAFLIFLAQQYGTELFTHLIEAKGTSIDALDEAIKASGGPGFKDAFRRWGAALALPDADAVPEGYGYPARPFDAAGQFEIPALGGEDFAPFFRPAEPFPKTIEAYSHLPLVDVAQSGPYTREVQVPPGVILSVYVK